MDILKDPETVKQLGSILKTNVRACKAVGHPFVIQLGRIYLDMLNVYKCLSENISAAIQTNGVFFFIQSSLSVLFRFYCRMCLRRSRFNSRVAICVCKCIPVGCLRETDPH